tara:strand:+ start:80 stop:496 length:417 start_codon:yes stop_codon:yes gene_type:complete
MAIDTNNIHVEEFIKENKVDGVATSITIKLVAYDLDDLVEFTGDGTYLNHNDNTWQYKTQVGRIYWDFDISPSLASISMNYTLPVDKRTTLTQTFTDSPISAEFIAERLIRGEWYDLFWATEEYKNMRTQLGTSLSNL